MDREFGRDVVIRCRVLAQTLLEEQLSLQELIVLLHHLLPIVLVFQQLLVKDTNKGVLIGSDILPHLVFGVAEFLDYRLDDFLVENPIVVLINLLATRIQVI